MEYGKKKLYSAHNEIPFYTWGKQQCCLPRGATRAALKDGPPLQSKVQPADPEMLDQKETQDIPGRDEEFLRAQLDNARTLHLQAGDILVFEEVLDPGTGRPENANPAHRHAVRLTKKPQFAYDLAARQALLEIEWDAEDKLPFSLCISAIIDTCEHKEDISIAHGNAILVDHGETVEEALKQVPPQRRW